jgi:hypothetical protein
VKIAAVALEDIQPVRDVGAVILARLRRDAECGAEERRPQLGHLS